MTYGHIRRHSGSPHRHSGASRNLWRAVTFTIITGSPQPSFRRKPESRTGRIRSRPRPGGPPPSFRRKPESRAYGHIHRHPGSPNRHSSASRNLGARSHSPSFRFSQPSLPALPTVIPAQAGIQCNIANHPYAEAAPTVIPAKAGIHARRPHCRLPQPSFRRKPESMPAGPIADYFNRHSGASRNPCPPAPLPTTSTVIPAQAGIHACQPHCRLPQPSFRRKPESMPAGLITDSLNRHSGASRNPCLPPPLPTPSTVIPVQAGIHAYRPHCRLPQPSFRRKPESSAALREPSLRRSGPQPSSRRKPESMPAGPIADYLNRHSGASLRHYRPPQPSYRLAPESSATLRTIPTP